MALDLQKLALRRLLEGKDPDLYSKLSSVYFTGANSALFDRVQTFYKANIRIPTLDEFQVLKKESSLQEYFDTITQLKPEHKISCLESSNEILFIGTEDHGVFKYDLNSKRIYHLEFSKIILLNPLSG